jgi:Peptidase family C25/Propeptide_C25/FlgD Ig-like domain/Peptidase family C25, C terminal ig-like domain
MRFTPVLRSTLSILFCFALFSSGAVFAERFDIVDRADEVGFSLKSQNAGGVTLHYGMNFFNMTPVEIGGETLQNIQIENVWLPNNAGAPDLPGIGHFIAIPEGASASFEIISARTQVYRGVELAPAPVIQAENDDSPLVYEKNPLIWTRSENYPAQPVMMSQPRQMRGVDFVNFGITPFQYNPVTKELVVFTEMEVKVNFEGGTGQFGEEALRNRYWEPLLKDRLINYGSLPEVDFNRQPGRDGYGWEYVIITPTDPAFVGWANQLKEWRKLQGISTEVFTTFETGASTALIEAWLDNAYANWDIKPVAFLLLGDYPNSGLRDTGITSPVYDNYCKSDNIYADVDGDHLPDMFHARICAQDAGDLETIINKMFTYEQNPYTDPGFYNNPVLAGGWQTERWFTICTEIVYGFLANELGKTPVREYAIYSGTPGTVWSTSDNTDLLLSYFGPFPGLGYIPPTPAHLNDWGANATRVNNDINAGAFMLLHRDHGDVTLWGEPDYSVSDVAGLHNTMYPYIFSINCLTGQYDYSGVCLAEAFHRSQYAALGVMAATEISYSFVNDTFIFGLMDGMWPEFMPAEDQASFEYNPTNLRPALAMVNGKYFLEGSNWPWNTINKEVTYHLFHHHGDCFMTLYSEVPQNLSVNHDDVLFLGSPVFTCQADQGAIIALTVNGEIIGVADGTGAPIDIPVDVQEEPGNLRITITRANYYRYDVTIPMTPLSGPYIVIDSMIIDDDNEGGTLGNGNGLCDAGETVQFNITLGNVGTEIATNVRATLTSIDEMCELTSIYAEYDFILPDGTSDAMSGFYAVAIDGVCPDGHSVDFTLNVESDERAVWEKSFSTPVIAPVFTLAGYSFDDTAGGNGNGLIETGETIELTPRIGNTGAGDAGNLDVHLVLSHPDIVMGAGLATIAALPTGTEMETTTALTFTVDVDYPSPDFLYPYLAVRADFTQQSDLPFELPVGADLHEFEDGAGDWSHYIETIGYVDEWHLSTLRNYSPGGTTSWKFGAATAVDYANLADGALESEAMTLRPNATLKFHHWMDAEFSSYWVGYCYDGGMVEIQVNDGPWEQIFPVGGYNYLIRTGGTPGPWAAETPVYSGSFDWTEAEFDISGYEGDVRFRWRFGSDGASGGEGWYIDDVMITGYGEAYLDAAGETELIISPVLAQNRPNPFGAATTIRYQMPAPGKLELKVFDATGRLVRTLVDGNVTAGSQMTRWDGTNDRGQAVGSGIYFYRLETENETLTRQMILTR